MPARSFMEAIKARIGAFSARPGKTVSTITDSFKALLSAQTFAECDAAIDKSPDLLKDAALLFFEQLRLTAMANGSYRMLPGIDEVRMVIVNRRLQKSGVKFRKHAEEATVQSVQGALQHLREATTDSDGFLKYLVDDGYEAKIRRILLGTIVERDYERSSDDVRFADDTLSQMDRIVGKQRDDSSNEKQQSASVRCKLGQFLLDQGDFDRHPTIARSEAKASLREAIDVFDEVGELKGSAMAYATLVKAFWDEQNPKEALSCARRSADLAWECDYLPLILSQERAAARQLAELGEYAEARSAFAYSRALAVAAASTEDIKACDGYIKAYSASDEALRELRGLRDSVRR